MESQRHTLVPKQQQQQHRQQNIQGSLRPLKLQICGIIGCQKVTHNHVFRAPLDFGYNDDDKKEKR